MIEKNDRFTLRLTTKDKKYLLRLSKIFEICPSDILIAAMKLYGKCITCGLRVWFFTDHIYFNGNWVHIECLSCIDTDKLPMSIPHYTYPGGNRATKHEEEAYSQ